MPATRHVPNLLVFGTDPLEEAMLADECQVHHTSGERSVHCMNKAGLKENVAILVHMRIRKESRKERFDVACTMPTTMPTSQRATKAAAFLY